MSQIQRKFEVGVMKRRLCAFVMVLSLLVMAGPHIAIGTNPLVSEVYAQRSPACGGVFPVSADASVYQGSPDLAFGGGRQLHVARERENEWRTLLRFDLAGRIPHGATIQKAELQLILDGAPRPLPYSLTVRNVESEWSETEVTWSTQPTTTGRFDDRSSLANTGSLKLDITTVVMSWGTDEMSKSSLMLLPSLDEMEVSFASREAAPIGGPFVQLLINCTMPVEEQFADQREADQRQLADFARIRRQSAQPLQLQLTRGVPRFAMFDLPVPSEVAADGLSRAQWFLDEYRGLFRLSDPGTQLQLIRRSDDDQHLFFRQRHQGIPVWPAELAVHLADGHVRAVSGNYLPEITLSSIPQLSAPQAETLALSLSSPEMQVTGSTQLRYVNLGLLGALDQRTYLAWQVNLGQTITQESLLIDANSGAVIHRRQYEASDFDLFLASANNTPYVPGDCRVFAPFDEQWFDEEEVYNNPDSEGFQSLANIKAVYNFWKGTFGRDSYDDDGEEIAMYIHVNPHPQTASYKGGCDIFEFGNTNIVLDIMGHEFSHAVDDSEGELEYVWQSGALDESFADIFGHAMDPGDWTLGEDRPGGAIMRNMANPNVAKFSDFAILPPDKANDYGGVHKFSGIQNKAAYLLTDGDTFNGRKVVGIGQAKAQELFYHTLVNWLGSNAQFIDARNGMFYFAYSAYGIFSTEVCQVRNAYAAVEVGEGDADCDGTQDGQESDNDDDGVSDGNDNCPNFANPGQGDINNDGLGNECDNDIDGDGLSNANDNCPYTKNPGQADFNKDGTGDDCDDSDGDYIKDSIDNCRLTENYGQENEDFDPLGDACDPDRDGDGKDNELDNCPDTWNPGQEDSDGDGVGDACDLCPGFKSSDNADNDGDGLGNPCDTDDDNDGKLDTADNCPFVKNPDQLDLNHDGVGFACDEKEQLPLGRKDSYLFESLLPFLLPVPDCIRCGEVYLPPGYEETLVVEVPVGFTAHVIDSSGHVVAKSNLGTTQQLLSFKPKAYANQVAGEARFASQADSLQTTNLLAPDDINYWLYILPAEGVDPTQAYTVQVKISDDDNRPHLFLPLVQP